MPRPSRKAKEAAAEGIHNASTGSTILAGNMDTSDLQQIMEPPSELFHPGDDSDLDQDFAPPKLPKRRGRPPKNPNQMPSMTKRPRKTPSKTPKNMGPPSLTPAHQSNVVRDVPDGEESLFEIVKSGKMALTTVIDDWIESYKSNRDIALLDLIQFFIHCSGCKGRVTPHMYHNMEHVEIIRKMTEEFEEESGDYPLIVSGPVWKKFKGNFCEFIQVLVRQCQYSIIYDQYMMDNVISLLTGLTDSQVRAFRHTSTLAAMKLMSALVDVALNLSINLDHTQRQYESERQKNKNKQASERLEVLLQKRQEIEENQEEIRNMLTYIFKGVFVHRYRDTQPEIRTICMQEIGVWMKRYPAMFLDDSYLKYVGWTLYDRVGEVRQTCLRCLQPLYDTPELAPKLELFTNRFKERIAEMTLDKEYDVAVAGVKLVIAILRCNDTVLSDKDCENVYELVYSSHRGVAQAAGEFLNQKLFSQELDEQTKNMRSRKGKKRSENTSRVRDLVQFFIESELHEHGAYLVDSLWEINEMLKDWECMTDLLLEEPGTGEEAMDDRQETSLIEIMVCCVKQAATGEYPVGRGPTRKLSTRENRQVIEDKSKLTEHFILTLPHLLAKYNVDAEKVANLLQIPLYFELDIYTSGRQEKNLESLLRHIGEIVDKHTDSEVLENCSKVMEVLCNEDYAISSKCNIAKSALIDSLVHKYMQAFKDFFSGRTDPDEDDAYALMASLKRIYAFFCCHDLNSWNLFDSLFHIVQNAVQPDNMVPEEIVCKAMVCCAMSLPWYLQALDKSNPDKAATKDLKKKLAQFMHTCEVMLRDQPDKIQEEAYITLCDLLIVFGRHLYTNYNTLQPLVFEPEKSLQSRLVNFLNDKVFVEDEDEEMDENQKIEELHKRRNFLACFCKLVVYNILHIKCASDMFKFYMRYYNDYGDIIKATLSKAREINKIATSRTLATSLTQLFKELQGEQGGSIDRTSEGFQAIKELARRFNLSFGLDVVKNREAVAAMHREGILFACTGANATAQGPPPNLAFLEVLAEFTSKLLRQDKKAVVQFLDKQLPGGLPGQDESWLPLLTYRNSLLQGETDAPMKVTTTTGRGRGRGKRKQAAGDAPGAESTWLSTDTPGRGGHPQLTSTAVKRRRQDVDKESVGGESEQGSERDFQQERPPDRPRITLRIRSSQVSSVQSQQRRNTKRRQSETSYSRLPQTTMGKKRKRGKSASPGSRRKKTKSNNTVLDTTISRLSAIGAASPDDNDKENVAESEDSIEEFESPNVTLTSSRGQGQKSGRSGRDSPVSRRPARKRKIISRAKVLESLFQEDSPEIQDNSVQ